MLHFIEPFQKELLSLSVSLIASFIFWLFRGRALLYWSRTHSFTFLIHPTAPVPEPGEAQLPAPPAFTIETGSFLFANVGRVTATGLEMTFNWRPDNFQVWPVRAFETVVSPDDRFTLKFNNLAPKETLQIEVLSARMPALMNVRCAEMAGRFINMRPMRVLNRWVLAFVWTCAFFGLAAIVYIALRLGSYAIASAT